MEVRTRDAVGYVTLPRILPRLRDLFSMVFSHAAYFVAMIFESVRLLPSHHPYLQAQYFGQYSVSQVLKQAYKNLVFDTKHLDQIIIFCVITFGIVIFFVQIIILACSVMFPFAMAGPVPVPPPQFDALTIFNLSTIIGRQFTEADDIAFMMLDRVFGVDDMFNSRYDPPGIGVGDFPYPYHFGLQALFQTFNVAMLVVGLLILTYFVITILGETVRDGTPFGRRFNRVWAPIRLVMAFGLLVPMANGLNAAQYIVLISAKWGSNFATNGLTFYYGDIAAAGAGETPFGPRNTLIAMPNVPDPAPMIQYMLTARACQYAVQFYQTYDHTAGQVTTPIQGFYVNDNALNAPTATVSLFPFGATDVDGTPSAVGPYFFPGGGPPNPGNPSAGSNLTLMRQMVNDTGMESIYIIFGNRSPEYKDKFVNVEPFCGSITMPVADPENPISLQIQASYLYVLSIMWQDQDIIDAAAAYAASQMNNSDVCDQAYYPVSSCPPPPPPDMSLFKAEKSGIYKLMLSDMLRQAIAQNQNDIDWCGPPNDPYNLKYGWGGAAICYNAIAQNNGSFTAAGVSFPSQPHSWPMAMDVVQQKRQEDAHSMTVIDRFNPIILGGGENGADVDLFDGYPLTRVPALAGYEAYRMWVLGGTGTGDGGSAETSAGGIMGFLNSLLGLDGVFNMSKPENRNVHPLALIAAAGRGLVQAAINNVGYAGGGLGLSLAGILGSAGSVAASFLLTFASIQLSVGFVLFYLIPLMPFVYFFFAVGTWVKGIFEAMVGVPLWALAHLRIDGDGIPGNAAMSGYMLILEIFLRPILIIFGLLASSLIFSAMVKLLNELWTLVTANMGGFDQMEAERGGFLADVIEDWRSPIDEFFYTVIYAIIVYMLALASFKLIDLIPNFILRWLGQNVEAFSESIGDAGAQLQSKATVGMTGGIREVGQGAEAFSQGLSGAMARHRQNSKENNE